MIQNELHSRLIALNIVETGFEARRHTDDRRSEEKKKTEQQQHDSMRTCLGMISPKTRK